jgi:hypothetical protein
MTDGATADETGREKEDATEGERDARKPLRIERKQN